MADLLSKSEIAKRAKEIGPKRGVYFLFSGDELVYIGKSPNVYRRLGEHLETKAIDSYYLLPFDGPDDALELLERAYIHAYMPQLNRHKRFWEQLAELPIADKTARALAYVKAGETPYAAARRTGIALSTIYRAQARLKQASKNND